MRTPTIRELKQRARDLLGKRARVFAGNLCVQVEGPSVGDQWFQVKSGNLREAKRMASSLLLIEKLLASPHIKALRDTIEHDWLEFQRQADGEPECLEGDEQARADDLATLLELLGGAP